MRISVTDILGAWRWALAPGPDKIRPARIILPVCRETVRAWLACGPLLLLPFLLTSSSYFLEGEGLFLKGELNTVTCISHLGFLHLHPCLKYNLVIVCVGNAINKCEKESV